jgi:thiosulfate reductase cytochrome b subunit
MKKKKFLYGNRLRLAGLIIGILLLLAGLALANQTAVAQDSPPLHPTFPLLDADGNHVLDSGQPLSTKTSCGQCHDTEFITTHSFHSDVGLNALSAPGEQESGQPWDISPGLFGKWNPISYGRLSAEGDERVDMTTADWVKRFGIRHVGGGPAETSRTGESLLELTPDVDSVETSTFDPETGELIHWDWGESGTVEMNCFLCHWPEPNNEARISALQYGNFQWANSATLVGSGIIDDTNGILQWNAEAFDEDGNLNTQFINVKDPANENCGLCHGLVHVEPQTPALLQDCAPEQWNTITTGQIMSPQKINQSGINIENKAEIGRSWDIHTERVVNCTDCHYSLNNPIYYEETDATRPDHLIFDPRRIDLGEYLYRPLHEFAKGQSAEGSLAPQFNNTLRRCESCHDATGTHNWLPYTDQHLGALSCESCHVPKMYAPARQNEDWTVLTEEAKPVTSCRGVEGDGETLASVLITGFEPVLLPRESADGDTRLAPHNLISSWFWVYGDPPRPVALSDLEAAWLDEEGAYHEDIVATFDANGDGAVNKSELLIDTEEKEVLVTGRLSALGLEKPRIEAETRPYSINHNVTHGEWATKDCDTCHSEDSRLAAAMPLSDRTPGGVTPTFVSNDSTTFNGEMIAGAEGQILYQPSLAAAELYILGHNNVALVDLLGALIFVGTILGVFVHGGLRFLAARRNPPHEAELHEVYMYTVYERLWHWLQTAVILVLLFTGLIIHKPDIFGIFSFRYVVHVHNIMAFILVANAALALFYNLASGEIKQYLPEPKGFFNQMFSQAKYYLQGIFRGDEHPFEKTPQRRLNPLQQVTYFGLLNVLLPLQVLTGIVMWGAQQWPHLASQMGGLPFLGPFHTLISWLLASFIVMHVYLTTTGSTATSNIKSMIMGWDEVESHEQPSEQGTAAPSAVSTD